MDTIKSNGISAVFDLLGYAIKSRKPTVSGDMPTVADLEAAVQELRAGESPSVPTIEDEPTTSKSNISEKATGIPTGCIPCSIGHIGTCSGLLNEAMRFARKDGVESEEVIGRINMCLDELNALERVDLRSEMIHGLPPWEKGLAEKALSLSRSLRHDLEQVPNLSDLEGIAADTQKTRQEIGTAWFRGKFERMDPGQREIVEKRLQEKLSLDQAKKMAATAAVNEVEKAWNSPENK